MSQSQVKPSCWRIFGKGYLIASVVAAVGTDGESASGERTADGLGDIANLIIQTVITDIEDLVADEFAWGFKQESGGAAEVEDMDEGTPGCAVADEGDFTASPGKTCEVVQDEVKPHAGGDTEDGGVPHEDRGEGVGSKGADGFFRKDLAAGVLGEGVKRTGFVAWPVAAGAVDAARGKVEVAGDACVSRESGDAEAPVEVNRARQMGVDLAEWVVGESGEVDDCVVAVQGAGVEVSNIGLDDGRFEEGLVEEKRGLVEACIEALNRVAAFNEVGTEDTADIAGSAGEEDFHSITRLRFLGDHGAVPSRQRHSRYAKSLGVSMPLQKLSWR